MKHNFTGSLLLALLISTTVFADDQHGHAMNNGAMPEMQQSSGQAMMLTEGIVKKIDQQGGMVTLQHGEIINIKMPAMTMNYRVKDAQQLKALHAGDKVRFAVEKMKNDYIVTHIELVKG